ncbi:MAG: hypothetical protein M1830_009707 [Pleopsidium flavum]|nr:MAG: hypothetical protein M1830_009707 [Pleopsidium flavum]
MDRPPPPPPAPLPPFGHGGPTPGLAQLQNDFTRMNINHNPANIAKPVVNVPKIDVGFPLNGRDRPPVTYEGFTFRKAEPEMFGQTKNWAKAYKVPMPVSHEALSEQVKKQQRKKSVLDQYSELDTLKQAQIDRLIEDKKREEKDERFEWKLAALKTETKDIGRRSYETTNMQVILARKLRASVVAMPGNVVGKGQPGQIVDLNAPKTNTPKGPISSKAGPDKGPIIMQPGVGAQGGPKGPMNGFHGAMPHWPEHAGFGPPKGPQVPQTHPDIVVMPDPAGVKPEKMPHMQHGHPDISVVNDRPPTRPGPAMGPGFPQHPPHMMQPQQQQPAMGPGFPQHPPHMMQPQQQQPARHQNANFQKPERKQSLPKVVNPKSHKRVEKWLDPSEDDETDFSESMSDDDGISVFTPDSSLESDSRRKRDIPRRGSLHKHHHRHSRDDGHRRPVLREHHRKSYSDPSRSRESHYHRDGYDLYPEDSHRHSRRPSISRRESIAYVSEPPRSSLSRPLTYQYDHYDDPRDMQEPIRPRLSRPLTYHHDLYDEHRDIMERALPIRESMPAILDRRDIDFVPPRRLSTMPYAPEPYADSGRERLNQRLYQQEMERREYIEQMRRPVGVGYPRADRFGYPPM